MSRKVLVTGATGCAGGALVQALVERGDSVRALVRDPEKVNGLDRTAIELAVGDLRDGESLRRACQGIDTVYHFAAIFRIEPTRESDLWDVNAGGTQRLLDAAIARGVSRFVHCSTVGVHGAIDNPPADEAAPLQPRDAYQLSKLEGERIASAYMAEGRIPLTIVRPTGIYGPGDFRFLKLFRMIHRRRFLMIGRGEVLYHLTYLDDLIDGVIRCGTLPTAIGQTYILAGKQFEKLNVLVRMIAESLGVDLSRWQVPLPIAYAAAAACEDMCKILRLDPPLYRRRLEFFASDRAFDTSKARRELGYEPKVDLNDGIRKTAEWYRERNLL